MKPSQSDFMKSYLAHPSLSGKEFLKNKKKKATLIFADSDPFENVIEVDFILRRRA